MKKIVVALFLLVSAFAGYAADDAVTLWDELKKQGQVTMNFSL